jgi:hypothetical protein
MKIPKEFKITKFEAEIEDKGKQHIYKDNERTDKYQLMAVLNDKIHFAQIQNFPYIVEGINKDKFIHYIKLFLLAQKMNCYIYIYKLTPEYPLIIKNKKYLINLLLSIYLKNKIKTEIPYSNDIYITIIRLLAGYSKKDIYNTLTNRYLRLYFPQELDAKVIPESLNDMIEQKYKLIKKYDNFESLKIFSNQVYLLAESYIKKYKNDKEFKKFYNEEKKKLKKLDFDPCKSLINPLYDEEVITNLRKFTKNIHLQSKHYK